MMNKKTVIYILLIICALGLYYYHYEDDSNEVSLSTINLSQQPIYQSDKMLTMVYDPTGQRIHEIKALKIKHFDEDKNTEFEYPSITLYNRDSMGTWHIEAKNAILTHDNLLYLNDDVRLNNLQPNAQLKNITTDKALVDLTTQIVTSDDLVTIEGESFTSTGRGLLGNLRNKTADILENVKTYYNAPNSINSTDTAN